MKKILTMALMAVFCVGISAQNPPQKECKKECQGESQKKKKDKKNHKKENEVKKSYSFTVPKIVDDKQVIKEYLEKNQKELIVSMISSTSYKGEDPKAPKYPKLFDQYQKNEQYAEAIQVLKEYMAKVNEEHIKDRKNPAVTLIDTAMLANTYHLLALQAAKNKDNKLLKEAVDCADSLYAYIANSRKDVLGILEARAQVCKLLDEDGDVSLRTKNCCEDVIARIDSLRIIKNDELFETQRKSGINNLFVTYYMKHGTNEEIVAQIMKYDDPIEHITGLEQAFFQAYTNKENPRNYINSYYFLNKLLEIDPRHEYKGYKDLIKELAEKQETELAKKAAEEAALKRLEEQ